MQTITFLKEVKDELSKVVWPSQAEVARLTVVVILVSIIVGLYLGTIDFLLTKITEIILTR